MNENDNFREAGVPAFAAGTPMPFHLRGGIKEKFGEKIENFNDEGKKAWTFFRNTNFSSSIPKGGTWGGTVGEESSAFD